MIEFPKSFSEFCGVFRRFAEMASANDAVSDGSDIDVELDDSGEFLDQNQTVADPIDQQQLAPDIPPDGDDWMNRMFDSDSDDDEFLGFRIPGNSSILEGQLRDSMERVGLPFYIHQKLLLSSIFFSSGPRKCGNTLLTKRTGMLILRILFESLFLVGHTTTASTSSRQLFVWHGCVMFIGDYCYFLWPDNCR